LRVGLIGCGFIGRVHSWALYALVKGGLVDAAVTQVLDPDAERAAELASPHDAGIASDLGALLGAVDVAWICTPTADHLPIAEAAAEAGTAVFCEKPLGRDLDESRRVAAALGGVPHQVGLVLRASPVFSALRDALGSGRHGRPMATVLRDDQYLPNQGQYASAWRADVARAGGGTLIEHSIHDLDLLRWLLGDPATVRGHTASFAGHPGIEDLATVELVGPSGATATLVSVWHQVLSRPSTRRLEVFCEDAFLWTEDDHLGPLHVETSDGASVIECAPPEWVDELGVSAAVRTPLAQYAAPAKAFLDAVAEGRDGSPSGADALAAHVLVDLAYRSAAGGGAPLACDARAASDPSRG
jgi:predicted dehydrogenase